MVTGVGMTGCRRSLRQVGSREERTSGEREARAVQCPVPNAQRSPRVFCREEVDIDVSSAMRGDATHSLKVATGRDGDGRASLSGRRHVLPLSSLHHVHHLKTKILMRSTSETVSHDFSSIMCAT